MLILFGVPLQKVGQHFTFALDGDVSPLYNGIASWLKDVHHLLCDLQEEIDILI